MLSAFCVKPSFLRTLLLSFNLELIMLCALRFELPCARQSPGSSLTYNLCRELEKVSVYPWGERLTGVMGRKAVPSIGLWCFDKVSPLPCLVTLTVPYSIALLHVNGRGRM